MSDLYFYETPRMGCGWAPCTSPEKPKARASDGSSTRLREGSVRLIPASHRHLTLTQLQNIYSKDGKFRGTQ